jgi:hypothetical protein
MVNSQWLIVNGQQRALIGVSVTQRQSEILNPSASSGQVPKSEIVNLMKQSILYKLILLTLVFSFLAGMGAHIALLVSGAEDSPLERWRLLGFGLAAVALLCLLLLLRYWQRRQAALNQAERQLYSLAPRPGRDLKVCDFWQRAPGDYVSRSSLDLPCAHISLELGGDHHQVFFSLSTPPDIAKGMLTQASQEWPKVEIRRLAAAAAEISPAEQNEVLVDAPRRPASAQPGASPTWRWQTLTLAQPDFNPLRTEDIRFGQPQHPSRVGGLLAEVEALPVGTIGGIQLLTRPAPASKRQSWGWRANLIRRQLHNRGSHSQTRTQESETASVRHATSRQYGPANPDQLQAELARITSRLEDRSLHEVCLRVWACGPKAESEVQRLSTAVISQTRSSWNQLAVDQKGEDAAPVVGRHFPAGGGFVMTGAELGQMLYLPNQEEAGPYARLHTAGAEPLAPEGKIIVARERRRWPAAGTMRQTAMPRTAFAHAWSGAQAHLRRPHPQRRRREPCRPQLRRRHDAHLHRRRHRGGQERAGGQPGLAGLAGRPRGAGHRPPPQPDRRHPARRAAGAGERGHPARPRRPAPALSLQPV